MGRADRDRGTGRRRPRGAQPHGLWPRGRFLAPGWVRARIHRPRPHPRTPASGSNALSVNHTFPCIRHGASERLLPSPARPRRICAFAPPAGSNSPTRHVENCGRPARGSDSNGMPGPPSPGLHDSSRRETWAPFPHEPGQPRDAARRGREQHGRGDPGGARGSHFPRYRRHPVLQSTETQMLDTLTSHRDPDDFNTVPGGWPVLAVSCRKPGLEPARPPHA